jgi:hypothetical protein
MVRARMHCTQATATDQDEQFVDRIRASSYTPSLLLGCHVNALVFRSLAEAAVRASERRRLEKPRSNIRLKIEIAFG